MTTRRRHLRTLASGAAAIAFGALASTPQRDRIFTVITFGDSILDCASYNAHDVHPGQLIVRNHDRLFPEFKGRDLSSLGPAKLEHGAQDGARVEDLARQVRDIKVAGSMVALLTIGGNDLLGGLAGDRRDGITRFQQRLNAFLKALAVRPVLLATVYDPTFGDDSRNFLNVDARVARSNLNRMNAAIAELALRYGELIDLHAHFLRGDPTWFTRTIEPSLRGASEIRAAFLPAVLKARREQA